MHTEIHELFREVEGLVQAGQLNEAERALGEIARLARAQRDPFSEGLALGDLASVQAELGDHRTALRNWEAAAGVLEAAAGAEWELVRSVYWPMARHAREHGDATAAEQAYAKATAHLERLAKGSEEYSLHLAVVCGDWAQWLASQDDDEGAETCWRRALAALEALPNPTSRVKDEIGGLLERHAEALNLVGKTDEAAAQLRRARGVYEGIGCAEGVVASLVSLARALWSAGDIEESRQLARDAASQAEDAADARPAVRGQAFENQARFLLSEGKEDEADTYFQLAEILYRRQAEEEDPDEWIVPLQMVVAQRATLLIQRKDVRGAAAVIQDLVDFWQPYLDQDPEHRLATFLMPAQRLAQLYQTLGESEKADAIVSRMERLRTVSQ